MEELQPEELEGLVQELEQETEVRTKEGSPPASDEAEQHLARAFTLEEDGEYEKALEACDAALRLEPTLVDAHNLRGVILEELGRERKAVLAYREALRLDPGFDAARENLQAVESELQAGEIKRVAHREDEASRWEEAGWAEEQVIFEAESQTGYCPWQLARVELEPVSGAVTICGHPDGAPTITVPVSEIVSCGIVEREDIKRNLIRIMEGGGGPGSGSLGDVVFMILLEIIDRSIAKGTKVPVIKLTQSASGDSGQGWVVHLRSKRRGRKGQAATLEMAQRFVAFLRQSGYQGAIPDELTEPTELMTSLREKRRGRLLLSAVALSSLAGLVVGLVIGIGHAEQALSPVGSLACGAGFLVALAVGAVVGAVVGAAVTWRKDRMAGMIMGAISAAVVASLSWLPIALWRVIEAGAPWFRW